MNRCHTLINIYKKHENYEACAEIKRIKEELEKLVMKYCKEPENNEQLLEEIDKRVQKIKEANI